VNETELSQSGFTFGFILLPVHPLKPQTACHVHSYDEYVLSTYLVLAVMLQFFYGIIILHTYCYKGIFLISH